jgi:hypothetical protein
MAPFRASGGHLPDPSILAGQRDPRVNLQKEWHSSGYVEVILPEIGLGVVGDRNRVVRVGSMGA